MPKEEPEPSCIFCKMQRAGAVPASTETVIFELLERAGTEEFRALLPLIKER